MANLIAGTILTFSFAMLEVSDGLILAMKEHFFPITKMIYQLMGRIDPNAPSVACALGVVGMVLLTASLYGRLAASVDQSFHVLSLCLVAILVGVS